MLGTIPLLAQEQYSTLSIPTNPRQTHPLRPPGMQLTAVLPHDLFLCINSKKKEAKNPASSPCKHKHAAPTRSATEGLPGGSLGRDGGRGGGGGGVPQAASGVPGRAGDEEPATEMGHQQHISTQILLPGAGGEGTGCPHINSPTMVAPEQQVCTAEHAVIAAVLIGMTQAPIAWQLYPSWRK